MNPDAQAFFADESMLPASPYWYYSATLRVPNPRVKPWQFIPRLPWPVKNLTLSPEVPTL